MERRLAGAVPYSGSGELHVRENYGSNFTSFAMSVLEVVIQVANQRSMLARAQAPDSMQLRRAMG
jgi:hypothetical protein